jgi:nicotinamidase-related amidase
VHRLTRATLAAACGALATTAAVTIGARWVSPPPSAPAPSPHLAIVDASIVDPRNGGRVFAHHTVLVAHDRIVRVAPADRVAIPPGARIIDGRGRFVIPGLWDSHVHTLRLSPQLHLPLLIAAGVTSVRDMGDACSWSESIDCVPSAPAWRAAIHQGTMVGPYLAEAVSFHVERLPASPVDTLALMTRLARRGEPFVKAQLDPTAPPEAFAALVRAASAAGLAVSGHIPATVNLDDPDLRLRSVEHDTSLLPQCAATGHLYDGRPSTMAAVMDAFDAARCDVVLARLARHGTAYVPTHVASSGQDARFAAGAAGPPDEVLSLVVRPHRWLWAVARRAGRLDDSDAARVQAVHRLALALTARAHAAGVVVLAGSDALDPDVGHGSGLHDELAYLVQAGLTPADALVAATAAPARHAGLLHERGTIDVGKVADLVVLTGNPLDAIAHTRRIETVVAAGRVFDAPRRQSLIEGVRAAAAAWTTTARLVRGLWWDAP